MLVIFALSDFVVMPLYSKCNFIMADRNIGQNKIQDVLHVNFPLISSIQGQLSESFVPSAHTERPGDLPGDQETWRHHILNGKGLRCLVSGTGCPEGAWQCGTQGGCQVLVTPPSHRASTLLSARNFCGVFMFCLSSCRGFPPTRQMKMSTGMNATMSDVSVYVCSAMEQ